MLSRLGLYIHVPFCRRKCLYCDFYSLCKPGEYEIPYADAICQQMKRWKSRTKKFVIDTVYIGGGTPSLLSLDVLEKIVTNMQTCFHVLPGAEITIEANPGTLTGEKLAFYRSIGINRLSIGMQSAVQDELRMLGRTHSFDDFCSAYYIARMEGFDNISLDLMYGIPGQTKMSLHTSLNAAIDLAPEHISLYGLKIEDNTPLARNETLLSMVPNEDTQAEMYMYAVTSLRKAGYDQYEISNFAKNDRICRHNMRYWYSGQYLGFGPSAASFFGGERFTCERSIESFISKNGNEHEMLSESRMISKADEENEYVMLRFRLNEGIDVRDYLNRFGMNFDNRYGAKLEKYITGEYVQPTKNGYKLSTQGMLVSNTILADILEL